LIALGLLGCVAAGGVYILRSVSPPVAHATETNYDGDGTAPSAPSAVPVRVVKPRLGLMEHMTSQQGSVQAVATVQLFAKVSGYLKEQAVDIGDRVKKGQVLAVVDVPEHEKQVQRNAAALDLAKAKVDQLDARVVSAKADADAAEALVVQNEASAKSAAAWVRFRSKQYQRMRDLFNLKSIDERVVDEARERSEAAVETERSSRAAILTAKAQVAAARAKVRQAEADLVGARAEVNVARAELEKSQVVLDFAKITSPFDGVVTHRALFPGDFVRSASEGSGTQPLLTIQRTDRMRVIVQIPDLEVPFTDPGDPAVVSLTALPGESFPAKVSRVAQSEDPQTRLMHIEIDLPNPDGRIRQGMYGRVNILLDKAPNLLSIPSACLAGRAQAGKGTVYAVRDGKAHRVPVRIGTDNGVRVEILSGLTTRDEVVLQPGAAVDDGVEVAAARVDETSAAANRR
jgi:RND family efflux transporter MFP subunit